MITNISEKFFRAAFLFTSLGVYLMFLMNFGHVNGIELLVDAVSFVLGFKIAGVLKNKIHKEI